MNAVVEIKPRPESRCEDWNVQFPIHRGWSMGIKEEPLRRQVQRESRKRGEDVPCGRRGER